MKVPNKNEFLSASQKQEYQRKWTGYEQAFYKNMEIKEKQSNTNEDATPVNMLNSEVRNLSLTNDRRIEIAILAMRQRNRFK